MARVWITIGQAAAMLGISPSTLRRNAEKWGLKVRRTKGGHRRFLLKEVLEAGGGMEAMKVGEIIRERRREKIKRNALERLRKEIEERKKRLSILKDSGKF